MRFTPDNFLYLIKQLVGGLNGDDTPVNGTLLPSNNSSALSSSSQAADGGIKVDKLVDLTNVINSADFPAIIDNTTGTAGTTFTVIGGTTYATDAPAIKNALAQIALQLNAMNRNFATSVSSVPAIATASGSGPTIGTFSFAVPRDYDEASDHLAIYLESNSTNADASITITSTLTLAHIASQLASSTAIVASTPTTNLAGNVANPFTATSQAPAVKQNVTQEVQVFVLNLSGYGLKRNDVVSVALAYAGTTTGTNYVYSLFIHYDSYIVSFNETDNTDNPSTSGVASANNLPGFGNPLR